MPDGTAAVTLDEVTVTAAAPATDDTVTIDVAGQRWTGWQRVSVTRSIDNVPATFDLQVTERYPITGQIDIRPGAPCMVLIGGEVVITGYVDRYGAAISPRDHTVRISGRSKSADLVDCAAFFGSRDKEGYQTLGGSTLKIARELAEPYGIKVNSKSGDGVPIQQFNIMLGETAWEIIDRITKFSELLAYDMPDGSIMLATAGSDTMASGFVQGVNVEAAEVTYTMDQRYSLYEGFHIGTGVFTTESVQTGGGAGMKPVIRTDPEVPRFRKRIIISTETQLGVPILEKRVDWEMKRRAGRSQAVTIICDSWRDTGRTLWAPNYLAPIKLPVLKLPEASWCIGTVTYTRDETGQHATVILMPPNAFLPEPMPYMPFPATLEKTGVAPNNPAAREPPT